MGIEPTPSAWKAEVLPLNYTRLTALRPENLIFSNTLLAYPNPSWTRQNGGGGRIRTFEG